MFSRAPNPGPPPEFRRSEEQEAELAKLLHGAPNAAFREFRKDFFLAAIRGGTSPRYVDDIALAMAKAEKYVFGK